jgi:stage V sporulation protein SpoVS
MNKTAVRSARAPFGHRTKEAPFLFCEQSGSVAIPIVDLRNLTTAFSFCLLRTSNMDGGQSMTPGSTLSLMLFALALAGVVRASDPQIQQSCMNVAVCALAVRSGFFADRRSDLQLRPVSLFASDQRSRGSALVNPSLS